MDRAPLANAISQASAGQSAEHHTNAPHSCDETGGCDRNVKLGLEERIDDLIGRVDNQRIQRAEQA